MDRSRPPGGNDKINAANPRKRACSGVFGTPGETRTHYLTLRRRTLCPGELRGLMQKLFNFPAQQDSNELPLRRRPLYPTELRGHLDKSFSFPASWYPLNCQSRCSCILQYSFFLVKQSFFRTLAHKIISNVFLRRLPWSMHLHSSPAWIVPAILTI